MGVEQQLRLLFDAFTDTFFEHVEGNGGAGTTIGTHMKAMAGEGSVRVAGGALDGWRAARVAKNQEAIRQKQREKRSPNSTGVSGPSDGSSAATMTSGRGASASSSRV